MSTLRVNGLKPRTGNTVTIVEGNTLSVTGIASVAGTMNVTGQANFASGANVTGVVTFANADLNSNLTVSSLTSNGTVEVGAGKSIKLNGASSGYTEIIAAAGSGSTTFVLPANGGSASQYLQTDGSGVLSWATVEASNLTRMTETDTSSTSSVTFDNIPSGVRKITISFYNVSPNSNSQVGLRVRLKYGATVKTTGYETIVGYTNSSNGGGNVDKNDGFYFWINEAAERGFGHMRLTNIGNNRWVYDANGAFYATYVSQGGGYADLGDSNELTGLFMSFGGGADMDSGYINVFYEV